MADDQGNKTTSIDNLINELTKQKSPQSAASPINPPAISMSNPPPSQKPIPPPAPSMSVPNPVLPPNLPIAQPAIPKPVIPPMPTPIPKPVMPPPFVSKPTPPAVPPIKPPVSPSSPVKEYQSSIRTMSEDLSSLKTGQKPSGVSVPRTVEQQKPPVAPPALSKPPVSPMMPGTQVKLGELQKTGPMAQQKVPVPAPMPKKEEPPQIIIPEGGKKMIGGNLLYIGITVIVVLAGAAYWFFVIRNPAIPEAVFTPTPSASSTPVATLNQLLSEALSVDIDLSESVNPLTDFNEAVKAQTISGGTSNKLNIKINAGGAEPALTNIFDKFLISYPAQLKTILGGETAILLYGQKEVFTAKGLPDTNAINVKKLIFMTEINDFAMAASISKEWELTMADGLKGIFELDVKKAASKTFLSSLYRETDVKYINFAYPDKTIDYAVIRASNGKNYLVVSGSREAIYGIIDKLK